MRVRIGATELLAFPPLDSRLHWFLPMIARVCLLWGLATVLSVVLALPAGAEPMAPPDFQREVLPVLKSHCVRCHGPKKQEASIRLDNLSTNLVSDRAAAESWHEVLNVLNADEMPPEGEKPLSEADRTLLTRWISAEIKQAVDAQRNTDGRVVLRRLNRAEYQNTMFDLLGLKMDYNRDQPPDAVSADGFHNNGLSLQMSALQLEYYLQTARRALDRVIVSGPAPKVFDYEFKESNVNGWLGNPQRSNRLGRQQQFLAKMEKEYPETGEFLVRVKLSAEIKPKAGYPLLEVSVGYRPDTKILFRQLALVEITSPETQTFEFRDRIENYPLPVRGQGKFPGLVVRLRNVYDDGSPLPKGQKDKKKGVVHPEEPNLPLLIVESAEFHGPVFDRWPPESHRQILFDSPLREKDESAYVAAVLERFMRRAYRRPVEQAEVDFLVEFFASIRPEFPTFEEAIRETLAMVLIQPEFLYLVEPAGNEPRPLNDWELASRLSYFLWSTMPDERLLQLASKSQLREPDKLSVEIDRMISDERSSRFVEQFTEQWLHLNVVDSVAISREVYPKFDDQLKEEMRGETRAFFQELLQQNQSALQLLSSDFTMLNEPLAKHYGIAGVFGQKYRRVALPAEQHRGGLLGHASVLLSNSTGSDSHAVRRAVWIRDRLLNDPPAPPPPDVPALDEADPNFLKLSIREQLEIHRGANACASCHRNIDPWGIALENFDAVGLWRDKIRRNRDDKEMVEVNASDSLPNGQLLNGADGLREYLATERKDDFARSLVTRCLAYSLGRRLELSDQQAIDDLTGKFAADGYRLRGLVHAIVGSQPFQTK